MTVVPTVPPSGRLYHSSKHCKLYCGDARQILSSHKPGSYDMAMCSPPYWGLRFYGTEPRFGTQILHVYHMSSKPESTLCMPVVATPKNQPNTASRRQFQTYSYQMPPAASVELGVVSLD